MFVRSGYRGRSLCLLCEMGRFTSGELCSEGYARLWFMYVLYRDMWEGMKATSLLKKSLGYVDTHDNCLKTLSQPIRNLSSFNY
jgi:hypothetical protein